MLKNYIHYIFKYFDIRKLLISYDYTPDECKSALQNIRNMEPDVFQAFLHWVATSKYPDEALHDIDVQELVDMRQFTPIAAFLAADAMVKDPGNAYRFLSTGDKDGNSSFSIEIPDDIKEAVAKLEQEAAQAQEDTRPFESPAEKEKG